MKKNLRIVSAAAALLAVAPVAATAMPVNAALNNVTLGGSSSERAANVVVDSHVLAYTTPRQTVIDNTNGKATDHLWNGEVNGTITATFGGQSYTANLSDHNEVTIYTLKKGKKGDTLSDYQQVKADKSGKIKHYAVVDVDDLIANTNAALVKEANGSSTVTAKGDTIKASTDQNGALKGTLEAFVEVIPTDVTNAESVNFFAKDTNTEVTAGTLNLSANPSSHNLT